MTAFIAIVAGLDVKWFAISFMFGTNIVSRIANVVITAMLCFQIILTSWKKSSILSIGSVIVAIAMFFVNPVVMFPYEAIPFGTMGLVSYFIGLKWTTRKKK